MVTLGLAALLLACGLVAGEWLVVALRIFAGYVFVRFSVGLMGALFWPRAVERRRRQRLRRDGREPEAIQCARTIVWALLCLVAARYTEFTTFWLVAAVAWGAVLLVEALAWLSPMGHRHRDAPAPADDPESLDLAAQASRRMAPFLATPLVAWVISWWYLTA